MSAQDLRDVMGLTGQVARPPPPKKQKTVEKRSLEKGMAREVSALMGERAPPISMIPIQPKYKQRPRRSHKAAPWVLEPFENAAREDGLVLHHWARKQVAKPKPNEAAQPEDDDTRLDEDDSKQPPTNKEYQYAKYNVQVEVPTYNDDLYRDQLQDPEWTKEETDYLVDLIKDFGQKWPVVVDRYQFHPAKSENGSSVQPKERSIEDLKHRYYTISAKLLAHTTPISSMNAQQYTLYSNLQAFNPAHEKLRKSLVNGHITRQQDEVNEETVLLAELQRIMINQQQLENERKDIRERLEFPISTSNASNAQYSSSAALGTLFQQLLQADRMKKDRKFKNVPDMPNNNNNPTPSSAQGGPSSAATASGAHRDSITSTTQPARKGGRDSLAGLGSDGTRPLNPQAEQRYFITHHDRLSSGVSFASDKLHKPRNAKSAIQSERIAAVLSHLQIPEIIPVPTQKVVEEFERLMQKVTALLDMRKLADKEEHEIKVRSAEKGIKGEKDVSVKEERRTSGVTAQENGNVGGTTQTAGQKRSASVMSESIGNEQHSSKRPKT